MGRKGRKGRKGTASGGYGMSMKGMDRETRIAMLVHHHKHPRHRGPLADAEVVVKGGNPDCGDLITIWARANGERLEAVTFEGEGCTLSQAAASLLAERVNHEHPTLTDLLAEPENRIMDEIGRDISDHRPRCATLALGTLQTAAKKLAMNRQLAAAGKTEADIRALRGE